MTHEQFELLSNQAVAACAVVYFLALLAHLAQWAARPQGRGAGRGPVVSVRRGLGPDVAEAPARAEVDEPERRRCSAGSGVALTVVAAFVHLVAIVSPRPRSRPGAGALGQHVRVHPDRHLGRRVGYLLLYQPLPLSWLSPVVTGFVLVTLMIDVLVLYTPGRAAARRAPVALAGDPRDRRDHRDRGLHPRRDVLGDVPGQAALGGASRPVASEPARAATSPGSPTSACSTGSPTGRTRSASRSGPSRP